jgi:hypothetical protein
MISLPFHGVYMGHRIRLIELSAPTSLICESGRGCICSILIQKVEQSKIIGELKKIKYM